IEALNANPTPSSDCKTQSPSTYLNSLLEETNTFDDSLLEFETFCFNVEEISSGSTTTHPDLSLPEYEAFYDDHVKEISSGKFEDYSDNSIIKVNAVGTLVPTVRQISPNITNTFSAAGPSNAAASPTYGKSSFIDASQLPDDPDMLELEDITYSNDEDNVGADADFNNLETSNIVNPIPTTRVHKDHTVTQIIGNLSSATQTRSMTRVVKDQGGLSQMFNDDFHTYVKTAFLYETIEEEVYVCQPPGFEDPNYPDKVYKVVKVKENQENDKIGSKPDKNGKRGEAGKSQKQLQSMSEDYRLTSEINRVAGKVNNVVVEKDQFLDELDSLDLGEGNCNAPLRKEDVTS
nr:ribonuclease H-like domain-containing protein [Tanacetum cinerariifolium]